MEEKGEGKAAPEPQRGRQRPPPDVFFSTRVDFFFLCVANFRFGEWTISPIREKHNKQVLTTFCGCFIGFSVKVRPKRPVRTC